MSDDRDSLILDLVKDYISIQSQIRALQDDAEDCVQELMEVLGC